MTQKGSTTMTEQQTTTDAPRETHPTEGDGVTQNHPTDEVRQAYPTEGVQPADAPEGVDQTDTPEEPESFPAKVVKNLRRENARYRERAGQADALARRLHASLVAATGKLADPTDLDYDEAHLEDPAALAAAVDELIQRKPHLKARRVAGDVGQGSRGATQAGVDLIGLMRGGL